MIDIKTDPIVRDWMMESLNDQREAMIQDAIDKKRTLTCSYMNYKNQVTDLTLKPLALEDTEKQ